MAGTLFVVATPIGNLEDMTFRAVRVLREVAVVAAEDTRHSGRLLRHFGIETPLLSLHEHNEQARTAAILGRLSRGEAVALVSDAGTPAVSDPGARLVRAAAEAGFRVEPVPGASAVVAAVSAAGLDGDGFLFAGFPPIKSKARTSWFEWVLLAREETMVVFFEAPHRILQTLATLDNVLNDQIVVFRELTKVHETTYRGRPGEIAKRLDPVVGEFAIVVPRGSRADSAATRPSDDEVRTMFGQITNTSARDAARMVAARTGLTPNEVYDIVHRRPS